MPLFRNNTQTESGINKNLWGILSPGLRESEPSLCFHHGASILVFERHFEIHLCRNEVLGSFVGLIKLNLSTELHGVLTKSTTNTALR